MHANTGKPLSLVLLPRDQIIDTNLFRAVTVAAQRRRLNINISS